MANPTRTGKPLNNQHVLDMGCRRSTGESYRRQSRTITGQLRDFARGNERVKELKAAGVPDSVILAMVKAS